MSNVTELPPHENMSVNQVLDHSKRKEFKKVLIIGIDQEDKLLTCSSKMNVAGIGAEVEII